MRQTVFYNKLVRDRIPDMIAASGRVARCRKLKKSEFFEYLSSKLVEEAQEFFATRSVEELADMLEVIKSVMEEAGWKAMDVERARKKKAQERGAFTRRLLLASVDDPRGKPTGRNGT